MTLEFGGKYGIVLMLKHFSQNDTCLHTAVCLQHAVTEKGRLITSMQSQRQLCSTDASPCQCMCRYSWKAPLLRSSHSSSTAEQGPAEFPRKGIMWFRP